MILVAALFSHPLQGDIKYRNVRSDKDVNFDWLLGEWERTNDKEGLKTIESWKRKADGGYIGFGETRKGEKRVFMEKLQIVFKKGSWRYKVRGVNPKPTNFVFTKHGRDFFICENKQNDFPKKIHYQLKGKTLHAVISDQKRKVIFIFERSK